MYLLICFILFVTFFYYLQRNYQFDFLKPQHSLFNYFTKLVEQYTKVSFKPQHIYNKRQQQQKLDFIPRKYFTKIVHLY